MQSHEGCVSLLPAVPAWLDGSFENLRARGGYTVSASWKGGVVTSLVVAADHSGTVRIRIPGREDILAEVSKEPVKIL